MYLDCIESKNRFHTIAKGLDKKQRTQYAVI